MYCELVAKKSDSSAKRGENGRPRVDEEVEKFALHMVEERNHQGKGNPLLFASPEPSPFPGGDAIEHKQHLSGMLKYYSREAA